MISKTILLTFQTVRWAQQKEWRNRFIQ